MRNKIILGFIFSLFFLFGNNISVYGWSWQCCKTTTVDSASTCVGGSCSVTNHACCDSNSGTYCNSISQCSIANAQCPSGWSTTDPGNSDSCTVSCNDCGNSITCYKAKAATNYQFYYCRTSDYSCEPTSSMYTDDLSCENNLSNYLPGQTDGTCYSSNNCDGNCKAPKTGCNNQPNPSAYCDDGNSCTTDTCNTSTGLCSHTTITTGSCAPITGGSCQFVSDSCYARVGGSCIPQYTTVNFIDGAIKPYNCTCEQSYQKSWGCWPGSPYACTSRDGTEYCYDTEVCSSCGGTAGCEWPHCVNCEAGYNWVIAQNCGADDCDLANYWANTVYAVFTRSDWNLPYLCKNTVDGKIYSYFKEMCDTCNGVCATDPEPACHAESLFLRDGADVNGFCQETWKQPTTPINGNDGICGYASTSGLSFPSGPPATDLLCTNGTPTSVQLVAPYYTWDCIGATGNCTGYSGGGRTSCLTFANAPPIISNLVIRNNVDNIVSPESGNRNHICQITNGSFYGFDGIRRATFEVTASDSDNGISAVTLTWTDSNNVPHTIPLLGSSGNVFTFGWSGSDIPNTDEWNDDTDHPLVVYVSDGYNAVSDSSRSFKFWDCGVSIGGTIFDGTLVGFSGPADPTILNFTNLYFHGAGDRDFTMNVNSPNYSSGDKLVWGYTYEHHFNTEIALSDESIRARSLSDPTWSYPNAIDSSIANPYDDNPTLIADFTGTLIQDPWYQAQNGGVISNSKVKDRVPSTCTNNDNCKISIDGLVAAPVISNTGNPSYQNWYYGNTSGLPNNNATLADYNTNYDYFYSQYFVKKGVGVTLIGDQTLSTSTIGTTGIYFISGNLNINTNKTLTDLSDFLMIIVKGKITVDQSVDQVDGILVASDIGASGSSDTRLTFNGSLYASNTINFSRDFSSRVTNNSTPAVVVNYDPKLIFNMPGDIAKVLTNWQWGN